MSTKLQNKIYKFLTTAEECQINAISAIYLGLKKDHRAVISASNVSMGGSPRHSRILQISSQFDSAFEGVYSLFEMEAIKTDKEQPLSSDQIEENINKLKRKLGNNTSPLYQHLYLGVEKTSIQGLTWKDPLANQIIRDNAEFVENLRGNLKNLKKAFMKPVRQMKPTLPSRVKDKCREFVSSFSHEDYSEFLEKFTHDGSWKECEEEILCIVNEIFSIMKNVWNNPAFDSEVVETLNEGTYQSTVIVPFILAVLKNLPFRLPSFISTSERESIASADRKGDGQMGRRPDIMFMQKKVDDDIKLWRECND
ncbi:38812_t:CDS:2, partial [Gigaspora margarita]